MPKTHATPSITLSGSEIMAATVDGVVLEKRTWIEVLRRAVAAAESRGMTIEELRRVSARKVVRTISTEQRIHFLEIQCGGKPAFMFRDPPQPNYIWQSAEAICKARAVPFDIEFKWLKPTATYSVLTPARFTSSRKRIAA